MASKITFNGNKFTAKIEKHSGRYAKTLIEGISDHIDKVRNLAADKFIIPRQAGLAGISVTRLAKFQPVDTRRLTERSGRLKKILKSKGSWKFGPKSRRARLAANKHMKGVIDIKSESNKVDIFEGIVQIAPKGDPGVRFRIVHELTGGKSSRIRKFLGPAFDELKTEFGKNLRQKSKLGRTLRA